MTQPSGRAARRTLAAVVLLVFASGDVAAATGGRAPAARPIVPAQPPSAAPRRVAQANPCAERQPQPVNPCSQRRHTKPQEPSVPPQVGRDKVEQMLKDRFREPEVRQQEPSEAPQLERPADRDDEAIKRLGERLRRKGPPPPRAEAPEDPG